MMSIIVNPYNQNYFMLKSLSLAQKAFDRDEVPVGAVIVSRKSKKIIAKAHNLVESNHNPTHHAEILAIHKACKAIASKNLLDYDLYVTLEPCAMCAAAISYARIGRVFYGAPDLKQGAVENGIRFFAQASCFHKPEIYNGILEEDSVKLVKQFFLDRR